MFSKKIDFLAIGDITTDTFIRMKEAEMVCDINREHCKICMGFGDKVPYESLHTVPASGNSANASVAASRLGLHSAIVTNIGSDDNGKKCLESLKRDKVDTKLVSVHKGLDTNSNFVLWYDVDRTILVRHNEFPYDLPRLPQAKWVYVSSLSIASLEYHEAIMKWLVENPKIKVAFQPGTFEMKLGTEKLASMYRRADIIFSNKEEAQIILKSTEEDPKKLLLSLHALGPKMVVITDGPKGAYGYDGNEAYFMRAYPDPKPPFERTGAGDAFSSTVTAALALGKTLREAMLWGPVNAASVIEYIGSQKGLLGIKEIEKRIKDAPGDYGPVTI